MGFSDWIKKLMSKRDRELDPIADDSDLDPNDPFPEPVDIEITDVFDLHTIPPRDVKRVVEEYLTLARAKGFRSVRIIHGKGIGVQRTMRSEERRVGKE